MSTTEQRLAIAEAIISRAEYAVREEFERSEVLKILRNPLPPASSPSAPTEDDLWRLELHKGGRKYGLPFRAEDLPGLDFNTIIRTTIEWSNND